MRRILWATEIALALFPFRLAASVQGQQNTVEQEAAHELARKIITVGGAPGRALLSVQNLSSFGFEQAAQLRATLETDLRARGFRLVAALPADAEIDIALSENLREAVWVAEIRRGDSVQVVIVSSPRPDEARSSTNSKALTLERKPIWQQREPILDFYQVLSGQELRGLLIAMRDRVDYYAAEGSELSFKRSLAFGASRAPLRDLRGNLATIGGMFELSLPGVSCAGSFSLSEPMVCRNTASIFVGDPASAVGADFPEASNHFTGVIRSGFLNASESKPLRILPFFSATSTDQESSRVWIFAGVDGKARLYENSENPSATIPGWGSEIAAVHSGCGGATQILVTGPGDWMQADRLQAYELADHQGVAVGAPFELEGPVVAFWPERDGRAARMVVHNLHTGLYEASMVSIHCHQ